MAKKMIRPIRTDTEYDEALEEIERYFENEPKPGTPEADRFDLLALIVEDYERKRWPIDWQKRSPSFCTRKRVSPGDLDEMKTCRMSILSAKNIAAFVRHRAIRHVPITPRRRSCSSCWMWNGMRACG